jgi:flagellar basal-body rod modification protein FlgD
MASSASAQNPTTAQIFANIAQASGTGGPTQNSGNNILSAAAGTAQQAADLFLKLLTTQLQHQNPEQPMDANQFVQQLVSLTQVSTALNTNQELQQILNQNKVNGLTSSLSYLGTQITALGNTTALQNGQASWTLQSPSSNVVPATLTIKNSAGQTVSTQTIAVGPGSQNFTWDGHNDKGIVQPPGNYTLSIDAKDASGGIVNVKAVTKGTVTGIDNSSGDTVLLVGTTRVKLADVTEVLAPAH